MVTFFGRTLRIVQSGKFNNRTPVRPIPRLQRTTVPARWIQLAAARDKMPDKFTRQITLSSTALLSTFVGMCTYEFVQTPCCTRVSVCVTG